MKVKYTSFDQLPITLCAEEEADCLDGGTGGVKKDKPTAFAVGIRCGYRGQKNIF